MKTLDAITRKVNGVETVILTATTTQRELRNNGIEIIKNQTPVIVCFDINNDSVTGLGYSIEEAIQNALN